MQAYQQVVDQARPNEMCCDPRWFVAVCRGLKHQPHLLVASQGGQPVGVLPLAFVKSRLFGRFLVSLPYINSAGVIAEDNEIATALIDRAVELADDLDVRHLELRHERPVEHPALGGEITNKVLMRLPLPDSSKELWDGLKAKVRNKVRKGEKQGFTIHWGSQDLLADFYAVFSRNMRDLGTPVFGERLFLAILTQFQNEAELCVVRAGRQPIAAGLLVHGDGATEVPSASSLRDFNSTNANDLMYWHLLQRAVERGQRLFDFGRSTVDGNTFVFKKKWGARPEPTVWQYYTRKGAAADFRPDSGKYDRMIAAWRRLPVWATRLIGPSIIRGIP
ncbi:MAG: FemAB family PEP-CTERM system-associated protein [Pirellulales bacterium]|nr:FemAB family PEP-CTERM system-associated protein [Pirellulales bacterium]